MIIDGWSLYLKMTAKTGNRFYIVNAIIGIVDIITTKISDESLTELS